MTNDEIVNRLNRHAQLPVSVRPANLHLNVEDVRARLETKTPDELRQLAEAADDAHHALILAAWTDEHQRRSSIQPLDQSQLGASLQHIQELAIPDHLRLVTSIEAEERPLDESAPADVACEDGQRLTTKNISTLIALSDNSALPTSVDTTPIADGKARYDEGAQRPSAVAKDSVLLEMKVAVFRRALELHDVTALGPSPLRKVEYPSKASVLWRWVDAPQDAPVWTFVRAYTRAIDHARVRSSLTMDDFYTLITFAQRCVLAALRNEDPAAVEAAFDALSAIDLTRVDRRDVVVTASLAFYAARRVELDPEEVLVGAVRRAEQQVGEILDQAATQESDLAWDGGYHEVATPAGSVLVESGDKSSADDLLTLALGVAELVQNDGIYEVDGVAMTSELPAVWLGGNTDIDHVRLRGCVKVHAEPSGVRFRDFLLVFMAETEHERDAEAIAAAAVGPGRAGTVRLGIAVGRRCVVVISTSVVGEPCVEDAKSLARFDAPIRALLM